MSMKYMLDTNICIYLMKHQPPSVIRRFATCRQGDVVISAITLAELQYGVLISLPASRHQNREALDRLLEVIPVLPFDRLATTVYAEIRAAAPDRRRDALDKLIASHAQSLSLTLVTNNLGDFEIFPNLILENWVDDN